MIHKPMITDAVNRSQIYSHFNKELRQVFIAITRVWCRKSFPSLFEMTIITDCYMIYDLRIIINCLN